MPLDKTENMFYYIIGYVTLQIFIAGRSIFNNRFEFCALLPCRYYIASSPGVPPSPPDWICQWGNGWVVNSSISLHPRSHRVSEKTLLGGCFRVAHCPCSLGNPFWGPAPSHHVDDCRASRRDKSRRRFICFRVYGENPQDRGFSEP
jgi:hypothetical protein